MCPSTLHHMQPSAHSSLLHFPIAALCLVVTIACFVSYKHTTSPNIYYQFIYSDTIRNKKTRGLSSYRTGTEHVDADVQLEVVLKRSTLPCEQCWLHGLLMDFLQIIIFVQQPRWALWWATLMGQWRFLCSAQFTFEAVILRMASSVSNFWAQVLKLRLISWNKARDHRSQLQGTVCGLFWSWEVSHN